MKSTKKTRPFKKSKILTIAAIVIGVVWLSGLTINVYIQNQQFTAWTASSANAYFDQMYRTSRVQFCYENDIKPCDDTSLKAWNAAHPDNTILVKG